MVTKSKVLLSQCNPVLVVEIGCHNLQKHFPFIIEDDESNGMTVTEIELNAFTNWLDDLLCVCVCLCLLGYHYHSITNLVFALMIHIQPQVIHATYRDRGYCDAGDGAHRTTDN